MSEPKELTPSQEAEHLIYVLQQRAELFLKANNVEEYNWCLREISRLQKSTGVTSGRKWKEEKHDRTA